MTTASMPPFAEDIGSLSLRPSSPASISMNNLIIIRLLCIASYDMATW
jgi:hypothetical protein